MKPISYPCFEWKPLLLLALGLPLFFPTKLPAQTESNSATTSAADLKITMVVVAEQTDQGARILRPTLERPAYYLAYDGGYIETGGVIAGLTPPSATQIGHTLKAALATQGYQPATTQRPPSIVLIYHWGSVRHEEYHVGNYIDPRNTSLNPILSLSYVLPSRYIVQMLNKGRVSGELFRMKDSGLPISIYGRVSGALEADRSFVIVTAYDYADLQRHQKTLLWRAKLSASEKSAKLADALPALIKAGATYFGRDFHKSQLSSAFLVPETGSKSDDVDSAPFTLPAEFTGQFDGDLVRDIIAREFNEFTDGSRTPVNDNLWVGKSETSHRAATQASLPSPEHSVHYQAGEAGAGPAQLTTRMPPLPPALAQRITSYFQEKAALQAALAAKIKAVNSGPDSRSAIDAFNTEYAERILRLGQTHDDIRSDLARFAAANQHTTDKPLDALLQEFAADIQ